MLYFPSWAICRFNSRQHPVAAWFSITTPRQSRWRGVHIFDFLEILVYRTKKELPVPTIKITTEIDLDIETAAKWFCGLDDDAMCRFLVAVAAEAKTFTGGPDGQWYYLGGHLKNCRCSTEDAREMIRSWAHWMEHSNHK